MTSPEDDDQLEEALRKALSEAASEVNPGSDGLDKIRARIAGRPPRPWLLSVLSGAVERVRNWTWRGHWTWPDWRSRLAEARWSHLRRGRFPRSGIGPLRLAAVLAGVTVIATAGVLGVQPFRNALLQASTVLTSGNLPQAATLEAGANRTRTAGEGRPSPERTATGGPRANAGSPPSPARAASTAKPLASPKKKPAKPKAAPTPSASPAPSDTDTYSGDSAESDVVDWTPPSAAALGPSGYGWQRPTFPPVPPSPAFWPGQRQYASFHGRWR